MFFVDYLKTMKVFAKILHVNTIRAHKRAGNHEGYFGNEGKDMEQGNFLP